jgi:hypothetical protein
MFPMQFTALNRKFVPLRKDQEGVVDGGRYWGRLSGSLSWADLLKFRRVVLLAEAASGKTAEFRNQAELLNAAGKPAFFVRIEDLADDGFKDALDQGAINKFEQWQKGGAEGWFFLDSVDEARLNHKSLESALRKFAKALDQSLDRAHIYVSCRVTDWKGQSDSSVVERQLPARELPKVAEANVDPLLDPIFAPKKKDAGLFKQGEPSLKQYAELKVVQIAPLGDEQYRALAVAASVQNVDAFITGISKRGLESYTERPGDLLDLAAYWNSFDKFGSLAEMTEHAIANKLRESDTHRTDNNELTVERAREGVERLAAALTLGKSFTLSLPQHDRDDQLAAGAIDPRAVLPEWNDAERNALLRRAVFAPSTYGRVRFHHRGTQEYLTGSWFDRLLAANCPKAELWGQIFSDIYGVNTVVPSLRPVAAWLALKHKDIAAEILEREPLVLIQNGDPSSLPLKLKEQLLTSYAKKDAAAEIYNDSLDHRALWMFADPKLANALKRIWKINAQPDFRLTLLRIMREGAISKCVEIARKVAVDKNETNYNRIVASQILGECKDKVGLAKLTKAILQDKASLNPRIAASCSFVTFPGHLSVEKLLEIIEAVPDQKDSVDGFAYQLIQFYNKCNSKADRKKLIEGLTALCLQPPLLSNYHRISQKFQNLAKGLEDIARAVLENLGQGVPPEYLIRLLMVIERSDRMPDIDKRKQFRELVQEAPKVNRSLFWADFADQRTQNAGNGPVIRHWHIYFQGQQIWSLSLTDLPWLEIDLASGLPEDNARVSLSAVVAILSKEKRFPAEEARLRTLVADSAVLLKDMDEYGAPQHESDEMRGHNLRMQQHVIEREMQMASDKASWQKFKVVLEADPGQLSRPENVKTWRKGVFRLSDLSRWLHYRVHSDKERAPREWRLLTEAFAQPVAEAYRDGLKALWRATKPERPVRGEGNSFTTKNQNVLAFEAVGLEASDDLDWASKLTEAEAERAAKHGSYTERGYPDWLDSLTVTQQKAALPVIREAVSYEWNSQYDGLNSFLYRFGDFRSPFPDFLQSILFKEIIGPEPKKLNTLNLGVRILRRLKLSHTQSRKLRVLALQRLKKHSKKGETDWALRYLAILLSLDVNAGVGELIKWLGPNTPTGRKRAEAMFAALFDKHDPLVAGLLAGASAETLERLLLLSYKYIQPKDDNVHDDTYSPDNRDNAEGARNEILGAILDRKGPDAYYAFLRAIQNPIFVDRKHHFTKLSRGKAERDSESPPWTPSEVAAFEKKFAAPVKTGQDLLRVVASVLSDIAHSFVKDDASSKGVLAHAASEDEVQNWLTEQLNLRSKGRYSAHREVKIAGGDKPDMIIASTSASVEVGLELKHSGKGWTVRQLENSLQKQLAARYLKPDNRRHGMFAISHHGKRGWLDPKTKKRISFTSLLERLSRLAATLTRNKWGAIEIKCTGINAASE